MLQGPKTEPQTSGIPDPGKWSFAVAVYSLSHAQVFVTAWIVAHWAPLSMGFPRQEYWSGLPFPSLGDRPNPGTESVSPALAGRFFTTEPLGSPRGPYPWLEEPPDIDGKAQQQLVPAFYFPNRSLPLHGSPEFLNILSETCLDHLALSPQSSWKPFRRTTNKQALLQGRAIPELRKPANYDNASLFSKG